MSHAPLCPDPAQRAPRAAQSGARLHVVPPGLQGALLCVISRELHGAPLSAAQRLTHLPATPFLSLCCFQGGDAGLVESGDGAAAWRRFDSRVMVSGSQSAPTVCWLPEAGRAVLVLFTADVARPLFGLDPGELHERFEPAHEALDESWWPLLDALQAASSDEATLQALERFVTPRWQSLRGAVSPIGSLRAIGRHWIGRLAVQAGQWSRTHSPRQVERRLKALSGRSLREWRTLVQAEGAFHVARDRYQAGQPFDWAGLAAEEGFADQAHLVRAAKRITGFTPTAFAQRYVEDESFWLYRLWV